MYVCRIVSTSSPPTLQQVFSVREEEVRGVGIEGAAEGAEGDELRVGLWTTVLAAVVADPSY